MTLLFPALDMEELINLNLLAQIVTISTYTISIPITSISRIIPVVVIVFCGRLEFKIVAVHVIAGVGVGVAGPMPKAATFHFGYIWISALNELGYFILKYCTEKYFF